MEGVPSEGEIGGAQLGAVQHPGGADSDVREAAEGPAAAAAVQEPLL